VLLCRYSELSPCTSAGYTELARNQPRSTSAHSQVQQHNVKVTSHNLLQGQLRVSELLSQFVARNGDYIVAF